jgi:hypothetical protein
VLTVINVRPPLTAQGLQLAGFVIVQANYRGVGKESPRQQIEKEHRTAVFAGEPSFGWRIEWSHRVAGEQRRPKAAETVAKTFDRRLTAPRSCGQAKLVENPTMEVTRTTVG